jgi:hypothetical protein
MSPAALHREQAEFGFPRILEAGQRPCFFFASSSLLQIIQFFNDLN